MNLNAPIDLGAVVERFDHISIAVYDIRGALPLVGMLGGEFRDGGDNQPGQFRWVQFNLPGAAKLELITPLDPTAADNFLVRFLDTNGEGAHHITLKVTDIKDAIRTAAELGLEVVGVDLSNPKWQEAFIHPKSANGVLVQLADWSDGAVSGKTLDEVLADSWTAP